MTSLCSSCESMKKENSLLRKSLMETGKIYVEVLNENLALKKELEELNKLLDILKSYTIRKRINERL